MVQHECEEGKLFDFYNQQCDNEDESIDCTNRCGIETTLRDFVTSRQSTQTPDITSDYVPSGGRENTTDNSDIKRETSSASTEKSYSSSITDLNTSGDMSYATDGASPNSTPLKATLPRTTRNGVTLTVSENVTLQSLISDVTTQDPDQTSDASSAPVMSSVDAASLPVTILDSTAQRSTTSSTLYRKCSLY